MKTEYIGLALPKLKTTTRTSLEPALSSMGMPAAFDESRADFSGIDGTHKLVIADVIQKAFVAIDEDGTEAAAATAVTIRPTSVMLPPQKTFRADHPYIFFIRDAAGNVLFMGRVVDPTT
jgi:serpin B